MASYLRNSGCLEKAGSLDFKTHELAYARENVDGQKRVSSQCEEVIIDTDLFDLKDACPDASQLSLEGCPGREDHPRHDAAVCKP